jgi:1-acyl-sn-glycerol-3-phosphate acyltransferase
MTNLQGFQNLEGLHTNSMKISYLHNYLSMKYLTSVYIYTIGSFIFLWLVIIWILITYVLNPKQRFRLAGCFLRFFFRVIFVKVKINGKSNVDKNKTYLFMANHSSLFDVPLLAAYIPNHFKGIEDHTHFNWPFWGLALKRMATIPINRSSVRDSFQAMNIAKDYLSKGVSVAVFPEGGRSSDGKMLPFKRLPFNLAAESKVSIMPLGLSGVYALKSKTSWIIRPATITITFGKEILPSDYEKCSVTELCNLAKQRVEMLIVK